MKNRIYRPLQTLVIGMLYEKSYKYPLYAGYGFKVVRRIVQMLVFLRKTSSFYAKYHTNNGLLTSAHNKNGFAQ